jgi:hypothetical protein
MEPKSRNHVREKGMSTLVEFVRELLDEAQVILDTLPDVSADGRAEAAALLEEAFAHYRLEIAGPQVAFDAPAAVAAAELVWQACWFLVSHREPEAELEKRLVMPGPPSTPAQHLSADLMLRYLPQIHRRARGLAPDDKLPQILAVILRQWPLTGILSEVAEAPLSAPDFGGHPGLMLLYAERLAEKEKPAWMPSGQAQEYVELVFQELGKGQSALLNAAGAGRPEKGDGGDE